jgi:prepilin-type N-terminal cleavage/methylation domain-containing protein
MRSKKSQTTNHKLQTNQSGFSMIEMLIVLTVVVLISIGFFYKFKIDKEILTELAAKEIVYSIREVKQKILSGDFNEIKMNKNCPNDVCIFGINFFGGKTYRIFIEKSYPPNYKFDQEDLILEEKNMPRGVSYLTEDFKDIFFESPYGHLKARGINDIFIDCSEGCFLKVFSDEKSKEVNIRLNNQGLVYVE